MGYATCVFCQLLDISISATSPLRMDSHVCYNKTTPSPSMPQPHKARGAAMPTPTRKRSNQFLGATCGAGRRCGRSSSSRAELAEAPLLELCPCQEAKTCPAHTSIGDSVASGSAVTTIWKHLEQKPHDSRFRESIILSLNASLHDCHILSHFPAPNFQLLFVT